MILVSVIIPFFKNIEWLSEAVESVMVQTLTNFEIIIINDGSPDDDRVFLEKYSKLISYKKVTNRGPAAARNLGIDLAKGKYIAFLDSDDLWVPTKLQTQVRLMQQDELVWSHSSYSVFNNEDVTRLELIDTSNFSGSIFPACLYKMNIGTPCIMISTEYLKSNQNIRFPENMRFGEDSYLWILLGLENKLGVCNEPLTNVRRTGSNAVQQARVHLKVKRDLYTHLIRDFKKQYPNVRINPMLQASYKYCYFCDNLIQVVERVIGSRSKKSIEVLSKILYLPAYIFYKFGYSIIKAH